MEIGKIRKYAITNESKKQAEFEEQDPNVLLFASEHTVEEQMGENWIV